MFLETKQLSVVYVWLDHSVLQGDLKRFLPQQLVSTNDRTPSSQDLPRCRYHREVVVGKERTWQKLIAQMRCPCTSSAGEVRRLSRKRIRERRSPPRELNCGRARTCTARRVLELRIIADFGLMLPGIGSSYAPFFP